MQKSDFKKGQKVYVLNLELWERLNNKTDEPQHRLSEFISDYIVKSVGNKYISVIKAEYSPWDIKFEIDNDFQEHTEFSVSYKLFLRKSDAYDYVELCRNSRLIKEVVGKKVFTLEESRKMLLFLGECCQRPW